MKKPRPPNRRNRNRIGPDRTVPIAVAAWIAPGMPLSLVLSLTVSAYAGAPAANQLPTGGKVAAGAASIATSGARMTVTETSQNAVINWNTFNVGANATVIFQQPNASSVMLNRVSDPNPSQIFGRISANGQVFLTNPAGVYFSPGASVDVGGLVATTHSISDADFMAGKRTLDRAGSTGSVVNEGTLKASLGGYIALLAPEVRNNGVVIAQMGTVALAAGETFTLHFVGDGTLTDVEVAPATIRALVNNANAVQAPGGLIILSAQAVNQLQGSVVNSGSLEASGLVNNGGVIRLRASGSISDNGNIAADAAPQSSGNGGTVSLIADLGAKGSRTDINGPISARGGNLGGNGGFVETSGGRVSIGNGSRIDTRAPKGAAGRWLIDPDGFTIAASGGDISGYTLSDNLTRGDVSIASTSGSGSGGNVTVDDAVTWSSHLLTLTATQDIAINAVMKAVNTASLDLEPGSGIVATGLNSTGSFRGRVDFFQADGVTPRSGTGFLTIGGHGYTVITDLGGQGSRTGTNLQGLKNLANGYFALGADIAAAATQGWNGGLGFEPLDGGGGSTGFGGIFDGLGHTVNGLVITRPSQDKVGLFGYGKSGTIRNIGMVGGTITGRDYTGGLMGYSPSGFGSTVSNTFSTAQVTGRTATGGLVGYGVDVSVANSYASGAVSGSSKVGGLIGEANGVFSSVFASGSVQGATSVGGLIGLLSGGTVTDVYAVGGTVTGTGSKLGGLVGSTSGTPTITRGLAGDQIAGAATQAGGLIGVGTGATIVKSFYDSTLAGILTGYGDGTGDAAGTVVGKTTTQLRDVTTYQAAGWASISLDSRLSPGYAALGFTNSSAATTWVAPYIPVYVRLIGGSSPYGTTPRFTYALYDASSGGNLVIDAAASGTAAWSRPLNASSAANTYGETYAGGLATPRTGYSISAGIAANWTITGSTPTPPSPPAPSGSQPSAPPPSTQPLVVTDNQPVAGPEAITSTGGPTSSQGTQSSPVTTTGGTGSLQMVPATVAIAVDMVKVPSTSVGGVVAVSVPDQIIAQTGGFTFKLPQEVTTGQSGSLVISATTGDGTPLPGWLRFIESSRTFVAANVPLGGLPIKVAVYVNGQRTDMTIAKRG